VEEIRIMSHPTPEEAYTAMNIVQYFIIGVGAIGATTLAVVKGKKVKEERMSIAEVEHRMTICKQDILLVLNTSLNERDKKLFSYIENQDEKLLEHIKDIIK